MVAGKTQRFWTCSKPLQTCSRVHSHLSFWNFMTFHDLFRGFSVFHDHFDHFSWKFSKIILLSGTFLLFSSQKINCLIYFVFHDFPGSENEILKFHDFPGFSWPVRTLCWKPLRCCGDKMADSLHLLVYIFCLSKWAFRRPITANCYCPLLPAFCQIVQLVISLNPFIYLMRIKK